MDDLVGGLKAGDAAAFETFVREHGDRLYRFVRRFVGDRWAEDATQEVFLKLHRSLAAYQPTGSFRAWVYTLANRVSLDFLRKHPHARRSEPASVASVAAGSEAALSTTEVREAILRAVEGLPSEQKQVFLMREEAGLSFREIAAMTGCPLNTALGRMHYAMLNLRKALAAHRP